MAKMVKFPSIDQLRNVAHDIRHHTTFVGKDDEGNPKYDPTIHMPVISFNGTVKIHGTNAGVCFDVNTKEMWCQSREQIISVLKDNAGFAKHVESNNFAYQSIFDSISNLHDTRDSIISIYGEWCGKGIQKSVAVSNLEKMLVIFGIKITANDEFATETWVDISPFQNNDSRIFNILQFPTYSIDIDFSKTEYSLPTLSDLTIQVEDECPVSKHFGISGIGEGIVWTAMYNSNRYCFKTKGEKHSKSKVKTVNVTHSTEKLDAISKLTELVTPTWRLEQGMTEVFDMNNGGHPDIKRMGDYLGWVMRDVIKEESDLLKEYDVDPKTLGKYVTDIARKFFLNEYNKL